MAKGIFLLLFLGCLFTSSVNAQNIKFIGSVQDIESKKPLVKASILLIGEGKALSKTVSDTLGRYTLVFNGSAKGLGIRITSIGYQEMDIPVKIGKSEDQTLIVGVAELKPEAVLLKEVVIKRDKRYSDTTIIDLSKEKYERSVMIENLLSGSNGFSKGSDEQLYYKGKIVSDLLVNGGSFFGKNNLDIYNNLPALILNNIQIMETNIDSVSNITMLRPSVKVSLNFKEEYMKGKFGNGNLGIGTSRRYIASTDLYTYKKKEQISFALNNNNINQNSSQLSEPRLMFSANGSNTITNIGRLSYRNIFLKKIEFTASLGGRLENTSSKTQSERKEEILSQFSKTFNASKIKTFTLDEADFNLNYSIDKFSSLKAGFSGNHIHSSQNDSLNYDILNNKEISKSYIKKDRWQTKNGSTYNVAYHKIFASKKGRGLSLELKREDWNYHVNENNNVYNLLAQKEDQYFIDGLSKAKENLLYMNSNFVEPLSESANMSFLLNFKSQVIKYSSSTISDTLKNKVGMNEQLTNNFLYPGIKVQRNFDKLALTGLFGTAFDFRDIKDGEERSKDLLVTPDISISGDYKVNKKANLMAKFVAKADYPTISQLTSIYNSYSLISQNSGNIRLKPEVKQQIELAYEFKKSDSLSFSLSTKVNVYSSKIGFNTRSSQDNAQQNFIDNIGKSFSVEGLFGVSYLTNNGYNINYNSNVSYQELPAVVNDVRSMNSGVMINQSVSTSKELIKGILSISPIVSTAISNFKYENNTSHIFTLTYSDKYAVHLDKFELNLFPFFNFNKNYGSSTSWAMNGEIKRSVFKKYGVVWLKAYDIFNSFKYTNNIIGSSYTETLKYANLQRYVLLGISLKFNNMK